MSADPEIQRLEVLYGRPPADAEALRAPPQSVEAEQAVLGSLMLDPRALGKVVDWLAQGYFYRRDHRVLYGAIVDLAGRGKPVDAITVGEWLEAEGLADQVGGTGYLVELHNTQASAANIVSYAEIVTELAQKRQAIELGTELVNRAFDRGDSAAEIVAFAQQGLANLAPVRHAGLLPARDGLKRWWQEVLERNDRPGLLGLPTPWADFNDATNGLRAGRLYVLAGRPGMGKSILGGQLASFTALRQERTALFSLEMSLEEVTQRNVAATAGVPHDFLDSPRSESDYWAQLNPAIASLMSAPLLVEDTPGLSAPQLCARAERAHMQAPLSLVVVDHLHEMTVDPRDRVNAIGDAVRKLKGLAKRLNIPVVLLAQLSRANTRAEDKRPTLTDLRASGAIEEVADVVVLIHREDYYRPDTHLRGVVELFIAKGRNIRSGVTVNLLNRYDVMRADDWCGPLPEPPQQEVRAPKGHSWGKKSDARARAAGGNDQ